MVVIYQTLYVNRYAIESMPIYVDHHARRGQVVDVALRLIAKAGLDAVTVRDVAEAAGCSTAIVSHYFQNKRELLITTYRATIERSTARWSGTLEGSGGDLRAYLSEIMPLDEPRLMEWRIWLAFWAKAAVDQEIAAEQRECVRLARSRILDVMKELVDRGDIATDVDLPLAARRVLATITGMAVEVMFDLEDWPAERQHQVIDAELRPLYRPGRLPASLAGAAADAGRAA
jgi:AcrR family transcriptional regulator